MITEVLIGLTVIALAVIFFYFFPYIFLQAIGLIPYIAYKQIHKIRLIRDAHFFVTSKGNIEFVMNSINWTIDRQERIGINSTNLNNYKINMSAEKYQTLFYLIVCILPASAFLFGVAMWSARRS